MQETQRTQRLIQLVNDSRWMMGALSAVRSLNLASWCIGAGAVRNLVWDALSDHREPSELADVDVAHFDDKDLSRGRDARLQAVLSAGWPAVPWEVTNQASVHLWFEAHFGHPVAPLRSLHEAVGTWPEYATAVGVWLDWNDGVQVVAPLGLSDLFNMVVRHNPRRASVQNFKDRTESKRYSERWPRVVVMPTDP